MGEHAKKAWSRCFYAISVDLFLLVIHLEQPYISTSKLRRSSEDIDARYHSKTCFSLRLVACGAAEL